MFNNLKKLFVSRQGASAVEFAMLLPIMVIFLFGVVDLGRCFWTETSLRHAVNEVGRSVMTGGDPGNSELTEQIGETLIRIDADEIDFTYNRDTEDEIDFMTIRAEYPYSFLAGFGMVPEAIISAEIRVPIAD